MSTSAHRTPRTSPDRAVVSIRNRNARGFAVDGWATVLGYGQSGGRVRWLNQGSVRSRRAGAWRFRSWSSRLERVRAERAFALYEIPTFSQYGGVGRQRVAPLLDVLEVFQVVACSETKASPASSNVSCFALASLAASCVLIRTAMGLPPSALVSCAYLASLRAASRLIIGWLPRPMQDLCRDGRTGTTSAESRQRCADRDPARRPLRFVDNPKSRLLDGRHFKNELGHGRYCGPSRGP